MERNRPYLPVLGVLLSCLLLVSCLTRMQPPELGSDADLAALTVRLPDETDVAFDPVFSADQASYACTVSHDAQSVMIAAKAEDGRASVSIDGASSPAGVTLSQDTTSIGVVVTAEDGTTRTYTVTVAREDPAPPAGIIGPEWPSPANPSYWYDAGVDPGTQAGRADGLNITYTAFDLGAVDQLWWGLDLAYLPQLSFSGANGLEDGTLAFVEAQSDANASVWSGEIPLTHFVGGAQGTDQIPVRFTIAVAAVDGDFIAASDLLAIDDSFDTSMRQLYPVSGDFTLNFLYEAEWGSIWRPAYDFFDAMNTPAEVQCALSFGGALYYTANE